MKAQSCKDIFNEFFGALSLNGKIHLYNNFLFLIELAEKRICD